MQGPYPEIENLIGESALDTRYHHLMIEIFRFSVYRICVSRILNQAASLIEVLERIRAEQVKSAITMTDVDWRIVQQSVNLILVQYGMESGLSIRKIKELFS